PRGRLVVLFGLVGLGRLRRAGRLALDPGPDLGVGEIVRLRHTTGAALASRAGGRGGLRLVLVRLGVLVVRRADDRLGHGQLLGVLCGLLAGLGRLVVRDLDLVDQIDVVVLI